MLVTTSVNSLVTSPILKTHLSQSHEAASPTLKAAFDACVNNQYRSSGWDKFCFALRALWHFKIPSTYLATISHEAFDVYRQYVPRLRTHLLELGSHLRVGNPQIDQLEGRGFRAALPDGTPVFYRLRPPPDDLYTEGLIHVCEDDQDMFSRKVSISVGEAGEWCDIDVSLRDLTNQIEADIVNNPDCFDPALVALSKLTPARKAVESFVNKERPVNLETGRLNPLMGDDVMNLFINLAANEDEDAQFICQNLPDIVDNLVRSNTYKSQFPAYVGSMEISQTEHLNALVSLYIESNLDLILLGKVTDDNRAGLEKALSLIEKFPPEFLESELFEISDKVNFIKQFTGLSLDVVAGVDMGGIMKQCVKERLTNSTHQSRLNFLKLEKLVADISSDQHEFDEIRRLINDCNNELSGLS